MRIITFPKLVATEESTQTSLKNCSVVIDGQNYLYNVYEQNKIPFVFGTEANEYAIHLRKLFEMYQQANVKCYIVLKGGDSDIERKMQKFKQSNFNFDTNEPFIGPVLVKEVYRQVLEELQMDYSICFMESKDECVALALRLGCPIISNDIEFCFRRAPYIPYITMKYNNATKSIQCRQFILQHFLRRQSLTEEKAVIFATLSDITVFPEHSFDSVFKTWGVFNTNLYLQHKSVMQWLSQNSEQEAKQGINGILELEADRNKFWDNCDHMLRNMRGCKPGYVTNYLVDSRLTISSQDPHWFEKGVTLKVIPPSYINLYKWKVIEGSWVTEDKTPCDSLVLSIGIVKYAYNLLTNFRKDTFRLYREPGEFDEIATDDPNISKPKYDCVQSVFENGWGSIKNLRLFEHFLRESRINIEGLEQVPTEATLLLIALAYYARKKEFNYVELTRVVYAVLMSFVMLNICSHQEGADYRSSNCISESDGRNSSEATANYFKYNMAEGRHKFKGSDIKKFIEFELCLQHMNHLNVLCGSPYIPIRYHMVYSGTFAYKMFYDMRGKNPDDFINLMFQAAPSVLEHVKGLIQFYRQLLGAA